MKRAGIFALALLLVLGLSTLIFAQQKAADKGLPEPDKKFVMSAASGGLFEVEAGNIALQKASSPDVKNFAQRMVDNHSKANDQLKQIAAAKGITLPNQVDKKQREQLDKLQKYSGADFDKRYMEMMTKDHKKDISEFQKEAKNGKDPEIKNWASQTLPILQEHEKMAQNTSSMITKTAKK